MKKQNAINNIEKLVNFVKQRAGLEYANYGDLKIYRREQREITADRKDFFDLLSLAQRRIDGLDEKLRAELLRTSGRLTMKENGDLQYITGQYFPTEYRPAACRILVSLLWNEYRDEKTAEGKPVYPDGNAIRKAIRRNLSRRTGRLYFA